MCMQKQFAYEFVYEVQSKENMHVQTADLTEFGSRGGG